jgi:predicted transcriptional regulator
MEANNMTPKKRTNDLIASEILKICVNGATKTRIVYQANLNFLSAKPYLDRFTERGFLEAIPKGSRIIYKTASKGMDLKERFERFQSEIVGLYACV